MRFVPVYILALLFIISGCKSVDQTSTTALNAAKMEKVVAEFCTCMIKQCSDPEYVKLLAPSFASKKDIRYSDFEINNYSPKSFNIDSSNPKTGLVVTRIHGEDKGWTHRVTWKVVLEDDIYYILPSGINESSKEFIDPWHEVDAYIK